MREKLSAIIIVSLLLTSINITAFAQGAGNNQGLLGGSASSSNASYETPSDAPQSDEQNKQGQSQQVNTPSVPTYELQAPYGVSLDDDFNLEYSCDEENYEYGYSIEVKIRSATASHNLYTTSLFETEDISELVTDYIDNSAYAGLECYVSGRVKTVPSNPDEALESGYSEWSNEVFYQSDREVLAVPENLHWNGETAEWDAVEHASQYDIKFEITNGSDVNESFSAYPYTNSIDVRSRFETTCTERELAKGTYSVRFKVKSLGGNTGASAAYTASEFSEFSDSIDMTYDVNVQKLATPENVTLDSDLNASWSAVEDAYDYEVSIDTSDSNENIFNTGGKVTTGTSINLAQSVDEICNQQHRSANETIKVRIRVQARCKFGSSTFTSSDYSESTEYVSYLYDTVVTKLDKPTIPKWDGGYNISWSAVDNAYEYNVNYTINGDGQWMYTTRNNYANLEKSIKEAIAFKNMPAGNYDIKCRVKAIALYSDTEHTHSDWSDWSSSAKYTVSAPSSSETVGGTSTQYTYISHSSSSGGSNGGTGGSGGGGGGGSSSIKPASGSNNFPSYVETAGKWKEKNGVWTYSNNGAEYKNKWAAISYNGTYGWFFFDEKGNMLTGWYKDKDGAMYYLNPLPNAEKGKMVTGKVIIDGKERIFDNNGKLIH